MKFIPPAALLLFSILLLLNLPAPIPLSLRIISQNESFDQILEQDLLFASVKPGNLYYTGCGIEKNGRLIGLYYYTLIDGNCQFYLLDAPETDLISKELNSPSIYGFLEQMEPEQYSQLLEHMTAELEWTTDGISTATAPIQLNALSSYCRKYVFSAAAASICAAFAILDLIFLCVKQRKQNKNSAGGTIL